ncbi:hypothetical protein Tco_1555386 [Tanacetum coccineum]
MQGTMLQFKTAELLFRMFEVDTMRIIKEDHFRGTTQEKFVGDMECGSQTELETLKPGQAKPLLWCYNCKGIGHKHENVPNQSVLRIQTNFKDKIA